MFHSGIVFVQLWATSRWYYHCSAAVIHHWCSIFKQSLQFPSGAWMNNGFSLKRIHCLYHTLPYWFQWHNTSGSITLLINVIVLSLRLYWYGSLELFYHIKWLSRCYSARGYPYLPMSVNLWSINISINYRTLLETLPTSTLET